MMTERANGDGVDAAAVDESTGDRDPLASLRAGTIIEGKHRVDRIIGRGGMGVVAAATHLHLEERVALKFLQVKDEDVSVDFRARFTLEARVCAKLRNEHIARVHDVGIWRESVPFMVMEYLEGADLRKSLRDGARLPLAQAVEYVVQICEGLAEAHAQGIIHRDLKPANIFVTRRPDGTELIKVLDFGISKWTTPEEDVGELTKTGVMLGSPKYMSPEQLNGDAIDARADVWAIGAILYQMLTGRPPYDFPQVTQTFMAIASGVAPARPSSLEPSIPAALDALILRCLTREKDKRVQNVAELAGAVLEAVESPFAGQVRAQIGAVLDPTAAASNRAAALSMTTGSHAVFALGNTGASVRPELGDLAKGSGAPVGTLRSRFTGRAGWLTGAAVAALALVAVARAPIATSAGSALVDTSSRSVAAKRLAREGATVLLVEAADPSPVVRTPVVRETPRRVHAVAPSRSVASAATAETVTPAPAPHATAAPSARPGSALDDRQ